MVIYNVDTLLLRANSMIERALGQPDIQKKLEACHYDANQLAIGKNLLEELKRQQKQYNLEFDNKNEFLEVIQKDQKVAYAAYIQHQKIIKEALNDTPGLEKALNLNGSKSLQSDGWLDQAILFYKNIDLIVKDLSAYGLGKAELAQSKAMIEALKDAQQMQKKLQKKAHEATMKRDKALNELQQWMYRFNTIAQIAMHDDVQTLEVLGIELES